MHDIQTKPRLPRGFAFIGGVMATAEEKKIAEWMLQEYLKNHRMTQKRVASQIRQNFGETHVYKNKNRNWGINAGILEEFRKLTPDDTVWSRSRQLWRERRESDPPGTRMVK
jgi:hypothetical protein